MTLPGLVRGRGPSTAAHVLLLAALSLTLNLHGIGWGLPNGVHDWSNDSVAPVEPLAFAKRMLFREAWTSKYPPFHYMVLAAAYAPYLASLRLTGGLRRPTDAYPYGLADPEHSLMVFTLIARLVSVAMGVGLVLVTYVTVRRLYDARAGLVAGLLVATSYPIIHYAHNANVDVPHLFWTSLALLSFVSLVTTYRRRAYVLLGVFAALAVATKDSIYAFFVGLALVVLVSHVAHHRARGAGWLAATLHRDLLAGLGAFLLALVVAFNLPLNWAGFADHVRRHVRLSVGGSRLIRESASAVQGHLELAGAYLRFLYEASVPPVLPLLLAGAAYALVRVPARAWSLPVVGAAYYLLFLRVHGTHHVRYVLPLFLLLTWHAGKLAADALAAGRLRRRAAAVVLAAALGWAGLDGLALGTLYGRDARYAAEAWMRRNIPTGATVAGLEPSYALPRFPPTVRVRRVALWDDRGAQVGDLAGMDPDYVVIGMGAHQRREDIDRIEGYLHARGYREQAAFKGPLPLFGRELPDLHSINPRIVVFAHEARRAAEWPAAAPGGGGAARR